MMRIRFDQVKDFYSRHKSKISLAMLLIISVLLFLYLRDKKENLKVIFDLSLGSISLLVVAALLFRLALGYNFKVLISFFDIDLSFVQWCGLTCVAAMTNYLLPVKAGVAAQAVYLKNEFGFRYTHFLNSVTGLYAVTFFVNAVAGTLFSILLLARGVRSGAAIAVFFLIVSVFTAAFIFGIRYFSGISSRMGVFKTFFEGFEYFKGKPGNMFYFVMSQVLVIVAIGIRLMVAFRVLGIDLDIFSSMVVALITSFSIFLSITPGNLGIKEFMIMFSAGAFGIEPAQGIVVAMLDRGMDIIISFVTGYGFTYFLSKRKVLPQNG